MFQKFYTLALNTFLETIRQPIYGVILVVTGLLLMLNVGLAAYTLEDDDKLLLDLGLSTLLMSGMFLAAFSAASVLSREIESKTVLTVISKPVPRPLFFLGKYVGLMAALGVAYYLSFLAFAFAQRHGVLQNSSDPWDIPVLFFGLGGVVLSVVVGGFYNYFYGSNFLTTSICVAIIALTIGFFITGAVDEYFNPIEYGSNFITWQIVIAGYLVFLMLMVIAAVALAASTRHGQVMTLVICTAVMGLGIVSDYALGQFDKEAVAAEEQGNLVGTIVYRAVPNMGPFWIIDGLTSDSDETAASGRYVVYTTGYSLLVTLGVLSIGVILFQKREVG